LTERFRQLFPKFNGESISFAFPVQGDNGYVSFLFYQHKILGHPISSFRISRAMIRSLDHSCPLFPFISASRSSFRSTLPTIEENGVTHYFAFAALDQILFQPITR
jgi:hypothetical protein